MVRPSTAGSLAKRRAQKAAVNTATRSPRASSETSRSRPDECGLAHQGKVRAGHDLGRHPFRRAAVGDCHVRRLVGRDRAERWMVSLERAVVDDREPESIRRVVGVEPEELFGRRVRQRIDEHGANDTNHAGRGAEADANREEDGRGQRRRSRQAAQAVAGVSPEVRQKGPQTAERRTHTFHDQVQGIQQALPSQPPRRRSLAVPVPAQFEELGQVVFDRPPIGIAEQQSQQPAHVTPSGC